MTRLAAVLLVALPAAVAAVEPGAHGEHHAPGIGDLLWPVLNFTLFLGLLARFVWPTIRGSVIERRRRIEGEIAAADHVAGEAGAELAAIEKLRSTQKEEGERIVKQLRAEGEQERAALVAAARRTAERLREDARRLGEQEAARAAHEIRREIAARAAARAAEILRQRIAAADEQRFLGDFLGSMEGGPHR
ncbi:MAG: hypothetical protein ACREQ9_16995 [Candidatus Binatia bacterium]